MKAAEIIEELDAMAEHMEDTELFSWLETALREYESSPAEPRGHAALYNELGGIARRNRWTDKSERAFLRAAEILERAGIEDGNYATTLNNLAGHYRVAGDYARSAELFRRCRELYMQMPELPADVLASVSNNLGLLLLDMGDHASALEEFRRAGDMIAAVPGNHYVHAVTAGNCGFAHYGLGDMDKARECMLRAAREAEKIEDGGELYGNYIGLYRRLGGKEA